VISSKLGFMPYLATFLKYDDSYTSGSKSPMCRTEALKMTDMKIADHQNVQALMDGREIDGPNVQT